MSSERASLPHIPSQRDTQMRGNSSCESDPWSVSMHECAREHMCISGSVCMFVRVCVWLLVCVWACVFKMIKKAGHREKDMNVVLFKWVSLCAFMCVWVCIPLHTTCGLLALLMLTLRNLTWPLINPGFFDLQYPHIPLVEGEGTAGRTWVYNIKDFYE